MPQARLELNEYTTRVLDVIKGKYGLKNRSEAINRFAQEQGEEYAQEEVNPEVLKHFDNILKEHKAEYGEKGNKMTLEELDKLLGFKD